PQRFVENWLINALSLVLIRNPLDDVDETLLVVDHLFLTLIDLSALNGQHGLPCERLEKVLICLGECRLLPALKIDDADYLLAIHEWHIQLGENVVCHG